MTDFLLAESHRTVDIDSCGHWFYLGFEIIIDTALYFESLLVARHCLAEIIKVVTYR